MATLTTERCGSYGNSSPHASLHPTNSRNNGPWAEVPASTTNCLPTPLWDIKTMKGNISTKTWSTCRSLKAASVWTGTCKTGSWFLQKVSSSVTAVCHFPSKTTFRWHAKETITVSPATKHSPLQPAAGPTDWKPCSAGRHPASSISYPPSPYTAANTATVQMETSFHLPGTTVSYSTWAVHTTCPGAGA